MRPYKSLLLFPLFGFLLNFLDGLLPLEVDDPLFLEVFDPAMSTIFLKLFILHLALRIYTLAILGIHCIQDVCFVQTLKKAIPGLPTQLPLRTGIRGLRFLLTTIK